jgi:hypothetical protein
MNLNSEFFCDACKKDCSKSSFLHSKKSQLGLDFCEECRKKLTVEFDYFYKPHAIDHTKREYEKMQKEWHCVACKTSLASFTKWNTMTLTCAGGNLKSKDYYVCENCSENETLVTSLFTYIPGDKNLIEMKSGEILDFTHFPDNEHIKIKPSAKFLKSTSPDSGATGSTGVVINQEHVKIWRNLCYEIVEIFPKFDKFGPLNNWIPIMKPTVLSGTNSKYLIIVENEPLEKNTFMAATASGCRVASCLIDDKRHVHLEVLFNSYEEYLKIVDVEEIIKKLKYVT